MRTHQQSCAPVLMTWLLSATWPINHPAWQRNHPPHNGGAYGASAAYSAVGPSPAEPSAEPVRPLTRGGQTMTTSSENEPTAIVRDGLEGWRETVAAARQARRQRGERYSGRHRGVPA